MEDQQQRKTKTIANLTLAAVLIAGVHITFQSLPDEFADSNRVVELVFLLPLPVVLICALGVLLAMRGWTVHWLVKLAFVFILMLPFLTCAFVRWAMSFL